MRTCVVILVLCTAGCSQPSRDAAPTPVLAAMVGPAWFEEIAAARGLTFVHRSGHETRHLLPEIMGGGAAFLDIDGDRHLVGRHDAAEAFQQAASLEDDARKNGLSPGDFATQQAALWKKGLGEWGQSGAGRRCAWTRRTSPT